MSAERFSGEQKRSLRPRFSLRALFILLTIFAISLGVYVERLREQREIVAQLRDLGATVRLSFETDDHGSVLPQAGSPTGPEWLRRWLDDDFFAHVTAVSFGPSDVSDDELGVLWKLRRLKYVSLEGTDASDNLVRALQSSFPELMVRHRNSAWLGVSLVAKKPSPTLVGGVAAGSAADGAGLQKGDTILAVNNEAIADFGDLLFKVSRCWPEEKIVLRIQRGGDVLERTAILKRLRRR